MINYIKHLKLFLSLIIIAKVMADTDCDKNITISFEKKPNINAFILDNPSRMVVDFAHNLGVNSNYYKFIDNKCIKNIRVNPNAKNNIRIVYDLLKPATVNTSITKKDKLYIATLSIKSKASLKGAYVNELPKGKVAADLKTNVKHNVAAKDKMLADKIDQLKTNNNIIPAKKEKQQLRDIVIVVDPGHGGTDPGATAVNGAKEKNICLQIAKKLVAKINATSGLKAYMTRTKDVYLGLRQRTEFAKKKNADLFISIHADSHPNSHARGVSVYALSESGATSEAARILADKENTLYHEDDNHSHHGYILESVLIDLQQVATVHKSLNLGKKILKRVTPIAKKHSSHVEQAAFVVLKSPTITSVLIETGFLSNKKEAIKLTNSHYQDQLSRSFMQSIIDYFTERKIKGSYFYASKNSKTIKVIPGDNLIKIASRNNTTVTDIVNLNKLKSKRLAIGQKIILPGT